MFELGQTLRKARIDQEMSLEELQDATKIRKRYLEAIEDGNFKVLPGPFYVRAFIKSYAEAVGLDSGAVLQQYAESIPQPVPDTNVEAPRRRRTNFRVMDRWNKWATRVMFWSFLLLVVGIIYYFVGVNYKSNDSKKVTEDQNKPITERLQSETLPDSPKPNATVQSQAVTPSPSPTPTPQPEVKLLRSENGTDYYQVSKSAHVKVELSITGNACWIQIDKVTSSPDGPKHVMIEQGTLTNGQQKAWDTSNSVFLTLGAANAVDLKVNGTSVSVGDSANVRRFEFDLPTT